MPQQTFLGKIVGWLRAGYPDGMPQQGCVVLLGILSRRLGRNEVEQVARRLIDSGIMVVAEDDIASMITQLTDETPLDSDIQRVAAHLAAGGWPLAMFTGDDVEFLGQAEAQRSTCS